MKLKPPKIPPVLCDTTKLLALIEATQHDPILGIQKTTRKLKVDILCGAQEKMILSCNHH